MGQTDAFPGGQSTVLADPGSSSVVVGFIGSNGSDDPYSVYFLRSTDDGAEFSAPTLVRQAAAGRHLGVWLRRGEGRELELFWHWTPNDPERCQIVGRSTSHDDGLTWEPSDSTFIWPALPGTQTFSRSTRYGRLLTWIAFGANGGFVANLLRAQGGWGSPIRYDPGFSSTAVVPLPGGTGAIVVGLPGQDLDDLSQRVEARLWVPNQGCGIGSGDPRCGAAYQR